MGAVTNMRPELWRASSPRSPSSTCVTTMSDDSLPLTVTEWEEWGDPVEDPEAYRPMLAYSPVRQRGTPLLPGDVCDRRASTTPEWVLGAGQVGGQAAAVGAGAKTARSCCGPSSVPATAALPGRYEAWKDEARIQAFVLAQMGLAETESS